MAVGVLGVWCKTPCEKPSRNFRTGKLVCSVNHWKMPSIRSRQMTASLALRRGIRQIDRVSGAVGDLTFHSSACSSGAFPFIGKENGAGICHSVRDDGSSQESQKTPSGRGLLHSASASPRVPQEVKTFEIFSGGVIINLNNDSVLLREVLFDCNKRQIVLSTDHRSISVLQGTRTQTHQGGL